MGHNVLTLSDRDIIHDNKKIPRGRTNALFQTFEDKIYIAGGKHASGKNNNTELNDVFSFDFKDKTFNVF